MQKILEDSGHMMCYPNFSSGGLIYPQYLSLPLFLSSCFYFFFTCAFDTSSPIPSFRFLSLPILLKKHQL
ncbi:hypothetical protein K737_300334 [Holospora undulata HU1]|uniref:Uncharacterized protein n=1 Tax=Holospora undulata HU1 TaxID=1321371 RepID=A0A061JGJ7_9PROT|nr:hypothetical protein K737_300334 [Holospora undulata HU1]